MKKYRWFIVAGFLVIGLVVARFASYNVVETWSSDKSSTQIRLIRRPVTPFFLIPPWERVQMVYQQRRDGKTFYKDIISQPNSSSYTQKYVLTDTVIFRSDGEIEIYFPDIYAQTFNDGDNWIFTTER